MMGGGELEPITFATATYQDLIDRNIGFIQSNYTSGDIGNSGNTNSEMMSVQYTKVGTMTEIDLFNQNIYPSMIGRNIYYELYLPPTMTKITLPGRTSAYVDIICLATTPPTIPAGRNLNGRWDIYVPDDSLSAYRNASYYNNFNIFPLSEWIGDSSYIPSE